MKIDAQDIKGARFEINLTELPARVFQHEYDHLQVRTLGIVMLKQSLKYIGHRYFKAGLTIQSTMLFYTSSHKIVNKHSHTQ